MSDILKKAKKAFTRQHDQSDCGVACIVNIVKYYGGSANISTVRELSGTTRQGTTLLGLQHAATQSGLTAEAYEAEITNLKEVAEPCILHVVVDEFLQHYVVCYGYENGTFIISDPAKSVKYYTEEELSAIWKSKALLLVAKSADFKERSAVNKEKRFWIKKLVEEDLNLLFIALFLGFIIALMSLSTAIFSQRLIDDILPHNNRQKLYLGLGLLGFLLVVKGGLTYVRQYFLMGQTKDFNNRIIGHFYEKLLFLPKSFFDTRKVGELIARLNDTSRIQNTISNIVSNVMIDVLLVIISSVVIIMYSLPVGLIALTYIPLYFIIVYIYNNPIISAQRDVMSAYAASESSYIDSIQGIAAIKSENKEAYFTSHTAKVYDTFQQKGFTLGKVRISFNLMSDLVATAVVLAVIIWTSFKVLDKDIRLGEMMAILQMMGMLLPATSRLALTNIQLQEAKVAFDRMFEFTLMPAEFTEDIDKEKVAIVEFKELIVNDLSFRFIGQRELLRNTGFSIKQGELVVLLGESGTGKSTLLQILQKFYRQEKGTISVNGTDWNTLSVKAWRDIAIGVPQQVKIFSGNVLSNIALGEVSPAMADDIIAFCRKYGFSHYFEKFPQSYFTILGEEGVNISGGQQQILALARALYKKPQLLLLDEATAAMDRNTESVMLQVINKIRQDKKVAVLMVTHRWQIAKYADTIYIMDKGSITEKGSHESLQASSEYYSSLWN